MSDINWKDGAVCYANGTQYHAKDGIDGILFDVFMLKKPFDEILTFGDFNLNEIRVGDYIEKSELNTEQKYSDVVEVFGLFGVYCYISYQNMNDYGTLCVERNQLCSSGFSLCAANLMFKGKNRVLTYNQLMAIGKLKRLMDEKNNEKTAYTITKGIQIKDGCEDFEFCGVEDAAGVVSVSFNNENEICKVKLIDSSQESTPKATTEINADNEQVKNPNHYQLMDGVESIEIIARSMTKEQWKGFCLGNMLKYRIRAGKKDALQQDIDKANFYGELYEMHKGKCYE